MRGMVVTSRPAHPAKGGYARRYEIGKGPPLGVTEAHDRATLERSCSSLMGGGVIDVVSAHRMARHPKGPGNVFGGPAAGGTCR